MDWANMSMGDDADRYYVSFVARADVVDGLVVGKMLRVDGRLMHGLFNVADIGQPHSREGDVCREIKLGPFCLLPRRAMNQDDLDRGCPCANSCCDDPDVVGVDHDCDEAGDDFCEECCYNQCLNCGAQCGCEV